MSSFADFLSSLDPEAGKRGKQFEHFVKWFLKNDPEWSTQVDQIWLWEDYPERWGADCGIDLVFKHRNGETWAVQSKCYSPQYDITKKDVDTFLSESNRQGIDKRLLIATTDRIGANAKQVCDAQDKKVTRYLLSHFEDSAIEYPSSMSELSTAKPKVKPPPRSHQIDAIEAVSTKFKDVDRGQLIMACGTGKTFTTLWIKERLQAQSTLVLLPSLGLLSQTLHEWTRVANEPFEVLCVCSDDSVGKRGNDEAVHSVADLAFPVTSDPNEIRSFLNRSGKKVVFSTYQSSPLIAEAQADQSTPYFDLAIADEAHRCAGKVSGDFSTILDAQKIRANKRLFTTATPRTYSSSVKKAASERGIEVVGMDDEEVFGKPLFSLSFGQAIKLELLTDYQVVIVGVDSPMVSSWIENRELLKTESGLEIDAETLASQVGLLKAFKDYNLHRVISFHSRVKRAEEFSQDIHKVIEWMDEKHRPSGELKTDFVSGEMPTDKRRRKLGQLKGLSDNQRGLLTNARCLSEGVDVPSLDGVAFIDPRGSQIDIIQAVGRAIRLSANKTAGTIVLPVFIGSGENPEEFLEGGNFKPIWDVLNALKAHDDVLADELDQMRTEMGRKGSSVVEGAFNKIVIDLPVSVESSFGDSLRTVLVENMTASWEFYFGLLESYKLANGDCSVPKGFKALNKYNLDKWVSHQRSATNSGALQEDRANRLIALGFDPTPYDSKWEHKFSLVKEYFNINGTSNIGSRDPNRELARWVVKQRVKYRESRLSEHHKTKLQSINFDLERKDFDRKNDSNLTYQEAVLAVSKLSIPTSNSYQAWARGDQSVYGVFPDDLPRSPQQVYLDAGWIDWSSFLGTLNRDQQTNANWQDMFDQYKLYASQFITPPSHIKSSDTKLKNWINTQRQQFRESRLSNQRIKELEKVGFIFNPNKK
ncbi:DEAD/DEAH box helicase [Polynucleobacter antarcticus]|uniref:Helicase n=1 Tax=Polynucleobacter antarcticus TaxID=1743162 RepID=A0A6M9PUK9_9BURK|nr:DEAD/DEAH box helicase [Polynucleobacter antarcticus]QKM62577.1 helicase [Polynucleobacter antarcticus]